MMLALHPHADADARKRARRLLSITCARLGALDVALGADKRERDSAYASRHADDFDAILERMHTFERDNEAAKQGRDQALADRHAKAQRDLDEEKRRSDQKFTDEEARVRREIEAEKLAAEQRVEAEKRIESDRFEAREAKLAEKFDEIRDMMELEIVTQGLTQILDHANKSFKGVLPVSKIENFLKTTRDDAHAKRQEIIADVEASTPIDTPAQRDAHARTLAAWEALHITQGFYMDKAVHRAPLVPLAHRRI